MVLQKNALSEWVDQYAEEMYSWASHKVSDAETAKDLVQDTFLAAAEKWSSFKGDSSPKTWLYSILNHKIVDVYRKKVQQPVRTENQVFSSLFDEGGSWKKEKRPLDWHAEEGHLLDNHDFISILTQCLGMLPEKWNLCVKLKYLSGKEGEAICQELNLSPSNYWQIIHRAKLQLRECIEENWFQE